MKLKIYQQGGGLIYTPFIPEQWVDSDSKASARGSSSSSGDEDDKINPLDKELLGMMKDQNLLPSDINIIYKKLIQFQRKSQRLSELGDSSYRSVMPGMLQLMNLVNQAKANKSDWDNKLAEIKHHNAGSEVAMDSYGRIWVNTEEGLKKINSSEFDPEKHAPVSNSQLMNFRQRNPSLGFQDDIFGETGMDVVGGADVRKEIDDIIDKFGTIKSGEFKKQVFKDIASDLQGDGIFKITTKYSKADLNDFSGLLFSRLSAPAKHLINANAAIGGYTPIDYIRSIISSETSVEVTPDYDDSLSKATGSKGSGNGGSESLTHDTYAEHLVSGQMLGIPEWTIIQPRNSAAALYAYAEDAGPILKDEKRFDSANLNEIFKQADALGAIVDAQNIYFGDQLLSTQDFPKVVYDNGSNMQRVWLPIKTRYDGHIEIDWEAQRAIQDLQEYYDANKGISDALMEEQLEDIPNAYWDKEQKVIRFKNQAPFLVVHGWVSSDKVRFDTKSNYISYVEKEPGDARKDILQIYNNAIATGVSTEGKKKYDYGTAAGRHLYEGNIYMPIANPTIGSHIFNYEYRPKSDYTNVKQKEELSQIKQSGTFNFD